MPLIENAKLPTFRSKNTNWKGLYKVILLPYKLLQAPDKIIVSITDIV